MRKLFFALSTLCLVGLASVTQADTLVRMETNKGTIEIQLYDERSPLTVANFLAYIDAGYYDGLIFHRVIPGFMIQGGGFNEQMQQKETNAAVQNESENGIANQRGTIAMARTNAPHSATSQFFINTANNPNLNGAPGRFGYAVFGEVVKGMDVVDQIERVSTQRKGMHQNVPSDNIVIERVTRATP